MTDGTSIKQMPTAGAFSGNEAVPMVQNGTNVQAVLSQILSLSSGITTQAASQAALGLTATVAEAATALQPTGNLAGLSSQSVSRVNILTSPRCYSTMDTAIPGYSGAVAKGDCQQSWALITCTASNTTVTVGGRAAQSQTLSCSINAGEYTLTVASGAFDYIDQGMPITVPGAGLNGAPLVTWIDLVNLANGSTGNTQIILRTPAQTTLVTSSQTVVWGNWFGSGDVGKPIVFGSQGMATSGMGSGGGVLTTTIVTVTNSNTIIVALAPSASFSLTSNATNWQQVTWGSDDSAAVNAVLAAALIRGDRYVYTPAQHYVPSLSNQCGRLIWFGEGKFYFQNYPRYVIPPSAQLPIPPCQQVFPNAHLKQMQSVASPLLVWTGDSVASLASAQYIIGHTEPGVGYRRFVASNPLKPVRCTERAVGATNWIMFDTNLGSGSGFGGVPPYWYTNPNTPWLGSSGNPGYIYNLSPDGMVINFADNDGIAISLPNVFDAFATIKTWSKVPDIVFADSWDRVIAQPLASHWSYEYASMFMRTFGLTRGFGLLDFWRELSKRRDGIDPCGKALKIFPSVVCHSSAGSNPLILMPYTIPVMTTGYGFEISQGNSPSTVFASIGELQFQIGASTGNIFRLGYDASGTAYGGTGNLYYQVDLSAAWPGTGSMAAPAWMKIAGSPMRAASVVVTTTASGTSVALGTATFASGDVGKAILVPGAGTSGRTYVGMITGYTDNEHVTVFPATPTALTSATETITWGYQGCPTGSLLGHFSITASANTLSADVAAFANSAAGDMIVVPGAGTGGAPLQTYIATVTDSQHVVLHDNAVTTLTASLQNVFFGTQRVITQWDVADDVSGIMFLGFEVSGDHLICWWQQVEQLVYLGPAARFGGPFQPHINTTGGNGAFQFNITSGTQLAAFTVDDTILTWPSFLDDDAQGYPSEWGDSGIGVAPWAGSGDNHPSTKMGAMVIDAVIGAQDFCLS